MKKIQEAVDFIKKKLDFLPQIGIILGTGLGGMVKDVQVDLELNYKDIPYFPISTVVSHEGKLIIGKLRGKKVVILSGRFHYYEGYTMQQVTFPIRVLKMLGIDTLIISNVSGSINSKIEVGDIVIIKDHINLQGTSPLIGQNLDQLGPRFPNMVNAYDVNLRKLIKQEALNMNLSIVEGVYVALTGPNLETPAEYNFLHIIGGDLVGMSTVPEVVVARHMNLKVLGISLASNKCYPIESIKEATIEEVIKIANRSMPKIVQLISNTIAVI